eukprot:scaffold221061_cov41-Prasinocladus_malaysianus.AAC.2
MSLCALVWIITWLEISPVMRGILSLKSEGGIGDDEIGQQDLKVLSQANISESLRLLRVTP